MTTELMIVEWLQKYCPNEVLLPQNFIFRLRQQMIKNVVVMPSEQNCLDWIYSALIDLGPPSGHFGQWQTRLRICLADCKSTGRYVSPNESNTEIRANGQYKSKPEQLNDAWREFAADVANTTD